MRACKSSLKCLKSPAEKQRTASNFESRWNINIENLLSVEATTAFDEEEIEKFFEEIAEKFFVEEKVDRATGKGANFSVVLSLNFRSFDELLKFDFEIVFPENPCWGKTKIYWNFLIILN